MIGSYAAFSDSGSGDAMTVYAEFEPIGPRRKRVLLALAGLSAMTIGAVVYFAPSADAAGKCGGG